MSCNLYCTTPNKFLVHKPRWKRNVQQIIPLQMHHAQLPWCHNKFALRILWICTSLSCAKFILWMRYAIRDHARWLYLTGKNKYIFWHIEGLRFCWSYSISLKFKVFNASCEWYWIVQWYEISHSMRDWCSIQLGFASLDKMHQSFTLCKILYHCTIYHSLFVYHQFENAR